MPALLAALIGIPGVIVFLAAIISFFAILNGYVLYKMWEWYVVPLFHLRDLTLIQAIALAFVIGAVFSKTSQYVPKKQQDSAYNQHIFAIALLGPLLSLAIGWIYKTYFFVA